MGEGVGLLSTGMKLEKGNFQAPRLYNRHQMQLRRFDNAYTQLIVDSYSDKKGSHWILCRRQGFSKGITYERCGEVQSEGKVKSCFLGPFKVLECVGDLAYILALPLTLSGVHNMFWVLMLRKYVSNPTYVLSYEPLELCNYLSYEETSIKILDQEVRELQNKTIPLVKVLCRNHAVEEATWKREQDMHAKYPDLFGTFSFEDEIYFKRGQNCNTFNQNVLKISM